MSGQLDKIRKRPVGRPKASPGRPLSLLRESGNSTSPGEEIVFADPHAAPPPMASFIPTFFCSRRCLYCNVKTSPHLEEDLISTRRLEGVFAELRDLGVKVARLTGGDAFARKDIFDVIEAACEVGIVPELPVKIGLTYYETLRLRNLGVRLVEVGLDAVDPILADRIAGLKGAHTRAVRTLDHLRAVGIHAWVVTVLTSSNAAVIGKLIDYLGGLGNVMGLTLTPAVRPRSGTRAELVLGAADRETIATQVRERASLYPHLRIRVADWELPEDLRRERPLCAMGCQGLAILPDGRVTACKDLFGQPARVVGDLRRQTAKEVWSSPEAVAVLSPEHELQLS
jgi:MoaA/NifB/PqqE/SkfB family radical SAM enzyme